MAWGEGTRIIIAGWFSRLSKLAGRRMKMMELLEKTVYFGIGLAVLTKERIDQMVEEMVEKGRLSQTEAAKLAEELAARGREERDALMKVIQDEISRRLESLSIVTLEDMRKLKAEIAELELKISKTGEHEKSG